MTLENKNKYITKQVKVFYKYSIKIKLIYWKFGENLAFVDSNFIKKSKTFPVDQMCPCFGLIQINVYWNYYFL